MNRLLISFATCCALLLSSTTQTICYAGYGSKQFVNPQDLEVDISRLKPGKYKEIDWNGHGILIYRRTAKDLLYLKSNFEELADPYNNELALNLQIAAKIHGNAFSSLIKPINEALSINPLRAINDEFLVIDLISRYVGCAISVIPPRDKRFGKAWQGGFYDPCRNVRYDLSGRVIKGHSHVINLNLLVMPHRFDSPNKLVIGAGRSPVRMIDFRPYVAFQELEPTQRLITAAELGILDQVISAVKSGARINETDRSGVSALFMAASEGSFEVAKWLLENGADPNLTNTRSGTPTCLVAMVGDKELIDLFGRFGADWDSVNHGDPNCEEPRVIWAITKTGSEEDALRRIKSLIDAGANPSVTFLGKTALDYAREANYRKVIGLLSKAASQRTRRTPVSVDR